jgi:hypothetical protein
MMFSRLRGLQQFWESLAFGKVHLRQSLADFDLHRNRQALHSLTDGECAEMLLETIRGKRLTYRRIDEASYA